MLVLRALRLVWFGLWAFHFRLGLPEFWVLGMVFALASLFVYGCLFKILGI